MFGATITTSIDTTFDSRSSRGSYCTGIFIPRAANSHIDIVTCRTKLSTTIDIALDNRAAGNIDSGGLHLCQTSPKRVGSCAIKQCQTSHTTTEHITACGMFASIYCGTLCIITDSAATDVDSDVTVCLTAAILFELSGSSTLFQ